MFSYLILTFVDFYHVGFHRVARGSDKVEDVGLYDVGLMNVFGVEMEIST